MPTSRAEKKAQTRRALKAAAAAEFRKKGLHDVGIQEITRGAGVAHGTFYVHFESKAQLVDELVDDINAELNASFVGSFHEVAGGTIGDAVGALAKRYVAFFADNAHYVPLFLDHVARRESTLAITITNAALAQWLGRALEHYGDDVAPGTSVAAANGLVAMWRQMAFHAVGGDEDTRQVGAETLAAMTRGALEAIAPGMTDEPVATIATMLQSITSSS